MNAPKHLTVRNVPADVAAALDAERRRRGQSLNRTVIELIRQGLGVKRPRSNGLAHLAGTWSKAEYEEFVRNTSLFEAIDAEFWK